MRVADEEEYQTENQRKTKKENHHDKITQSKTYLTILASKESQKEPEIVFLKQMETKNYQ